jgi:hypothetical protein
MGTIFSKCERYRYTLTREWDNGPKLAFIMLNPSTADAELDDPTIRRCIRFSHDAGYDGIFVGNLFAWRATNPAELKTTLDPVGPANDLALTKLIASSPTVVCAWGNLAPSCDRNRIVLQMIRDLGKIPHCLRMTGKGHPGHPLYAPAILRPIPMPA